MHAARGQRRCARPNHAGQGHALQQRMAFLRHEGADKIFWLTGGEQFCGSTSEPHRPSTRRPRPVEFACRLKRQMTMFRLRHAREGANRFG